MYACVSSPMVTESSLSLTPLLLLFHSLHVLDSKTSSEDFVKYSRRSMRLLSEDALSEFPLQAITVTTPCGPCPGVQALPADQICAVSIIRSGDCLLEVRTYLHTCVVQHDKQRACSCISHVVVRWWRSSRTIAPRPMTISFSRHCGCFCYTLRRDF